VLVRVAVIGLGLIGGSVLRALAALETHRITGYDTDPAIRAMARTASGQEPPARRWQVAASLRAAADDADLVIPAVPFPAFASVVDDLANAGFSGLISDVTSVKGPTRAVIADRWKRSGVALHGYVGGHPMAGREVNGFAGGDAHLFRGRAWALALEQETSTADWITVARLITSLGARVVPVTAAEHDQAVAAVSHVPHLLAAALMKAAARSPLALSLGAGSFHDGTRVAASSPTLTSAMCGANAEAVQEALETVREELDRAVRLMDAVDPIAALRPWFIPASEARQAWPPDPSDPRDVPADPGVLLRLGRAGGWIIDVAPDGRTVTAVRPRS
jgi:prephenate dehydrogenase